MRLGGYQLTKDAASQYVERTTAQRVVHPGFADSFRPARQPNTNYLNNVRGWAEFAVWRALRGCPRVQGGAERLPRRGLQPPRASAGCTWRAGCLPVTPPAAPAVQDVALYKLSAPVTTLPTLRLVGRKRERRAARGACARLPAVSCWLAACPAMPGELADCACSQQLRCPAHQAPPAAAPTLSARQPSRATRCQTARRC